MPEPLRSPAGLMINRIADIIIVEFLDSNILDQMQVEQFRRELEDLVDKAGLPKMVISFEDVAHISSAVLGALLSINKKITAKKGELRLAHVGPSIRTVFTLTKLDKLFKIYATTDEAWRRW